MTNGTAAPAQTRAWGQGGAVPRRGAWRTADAGAGLAIAGHASLFGVADLSRDVVEPGAFAAALGLRGAGRIRMLFQHDPAQPVGVWTAMRENAQGLWVEGRLTAGPGKAGELAALIADGAVDGLSIGFRTVRARTDPRTRLRHILEADLWEVSIVTFPMLPGARLKLKGGPEVPEATHALCAARAFSARLRAAACAAETRPR